MQGFANAAVGCLPYGSGNDFLRTYGTREEFTDLDAQLAGGEVTIDLMQTNLGLSATICAAGLDAQVAYGIPKFRRIPLCGGEMAYALSIVEQLCGHIGRKIEYDHRRRKTDRGLPHVRDLQWQGLRRRFPCGARRPCPDDGWLDVVHHPQGGPADHCKAAGDVQARAGTFVHGQLTEQAKPYFIYRRAKQVTLRPVDGRGPIVATADGECAPCDRVDDRRSSPLSARILLPKAVL